MFFQPLCLFPNRDFSDQFIYDLYQVSAFVLVGNVIFRVIVLPYFFNIWPWISKNKFACCALAKKKGLFAYGVIFYFRMVKKKPTLAKWAFCQSFLGHYLPRYTVSIDKSAGDTPEILDACPRVSGLILFSFCLPSAESAVMDR